MAALTEAQKVRRRIKQVWRQKTRAELELAKIKKQQRSAEANGKYLLGMLADLAGWELLSIPDAEKRIQRVASTITNAEDISRFRDVGNRVFHQRKVAKLRPTKSGTTEDSKLSGEAGVSEHLGGATVAPSPTRLVDSERSTEHIRKAAIHYRITLGGLWIKYGMGAESKSVILGAMVLDDGRDVD